jgi:hypothetical protein
MDVDSLHGGRSQVKAAWRRTTVRPTPARRGWMGVGGWCTIGCCLQTFSILELHRVAPSCLFSRKLVSEQHRRRVRGACCRLCRRYRSIGNKADPLPSERDAEKLHHFTHCTHPQHHPLAVLLDRCIRRWSVGERLLLRDGRCV